MPTLHQATFRDFLQQRTAHQTAVSIELAFVDLCGGDHLAALMLSLVVDQAARPTHQPTRDGWTQIPWQLTWERARVPRKKGRALLNRLIGLGYCRTRLMKVRGAPTLHVRLNEAAFLAAWHGVVNGQAPLLPED